MAIGTISGRKCAEHQLRCHGLLCAREDSQCRHALRSRVTDSTCKIIHIINCVVYYSNPLKNLRYRAALRAASGINLGHFGQRK